MRMSRPLKKVTVYFTAEEYAPFKAIAEDEEVTLSAVLRAKLGLGYRRRGAPEGNTNRRVPVNITLEMEGREREK
jgi:hypothetical protein